MKELGIGLLKLIGGTLVSLIVLVPGLIHFFFYAIYISFKKRNPFTFFILYWEVIDANLAAIGYLLGAIAYTQDLFWNSNSGEMFEDVLTDEEDTLYRKKLVSISSATGDIILRHKLKQNRSWFNKMLNWGFQQKQHAVDSILYDRAVRSLRKDFFK